MDHIKKEFEAVQRKAPSDLWSKIDSCVNLAADDIIIKESFEEVSRTAPEGSWQSINRQLVIDDVWNRIAAYYDKKKRRIAWFWTGIVLVLIGSSLVFLLQDNQGTVRYTSYPRSTGPDSNQHDLGVDIAVDEISNSGNNKEFNGTTVNIYQEDLLVNDEIVESNTSIVEDVYSVAESSVFLVDPIISDNYEGQLSNDQLVLSDDRESDLLQLLNSSTITPLKFSPIYPELVRIEQQEQKRKKYISLGTVVYAGSSWILNNEVKSGFNSNSLIQNKLSLGWMTGVQMDFHLSKSWGIEAEYDFFSQLNQSYNYYDEGRFSEQRFRINQQKIGITPYIGKQLMSGVDVRGYVGPFVSYTMIDYQVQSENQSAAEFATLDYGFRLGGGVSKPLGRLLLGIGIRSDVGIFNIATNQQLLPKKFNYTTTLTAGGYLSLSYRF